MIARQTAGGIIEKKKQQGSEIITKGIKTNSSKAKNYYQKNKAKIAARKARITAENNKERESLEEKENKTNQKKFLI